MACSYEPLPAGSGHEQLQEMITTMLQPNPQARPTIGQVVEMVHKYQQQ